MRVPTAVRQGYRRPEVTMHPFSLLFLVACAGDANPPGGDSAADTDADTDTGADTSGDTDTGADTSGDTDTGELCIATWTPSGGSTVDLVAADLGGEGATALVSWQAPADGTLALCADTYRLNVEVIAGRSLTLTSVDPIHPAVVDGEDGVAVFADSAAAITLADLELRGDVPLWLKCSDSADPCLGVVVDLSHVVVTGGSITSYDTNAVLRASDSVFEPRADYASSAITGSWWELTLRRVTVRDHTAGGLLVTAYGPSVVVTDSELSGLGNAGGGALDLDWTLNFSDQTLDLTGTTFSDNLAGGVLGTVYVKPGGPLTVTGGTFVDNAASAAIDLGWAKSVVSGVTVSGQEYGGGVKGVATEWSDITCDGVWDSCVTLRESLGAGAQPHATLSGGSMTGGSNYAVQITYVGGSADVVGIDFGTAANGNEYGDVAYGGHFYDYDGVTTVSCADGSCTE